MKITLRIIKSGPYKGGVAAFLAGDNSVVYKDWQNKLVQGPYGRIVKYEDIGETEDVEFTDEKIERTPFERACIEMGESFVKELTLGVDARKLREEYEDKKKKFFEQRAASREKMAALLVLKGYTQEDADKICQIIAAKADAAIPPDGDEEG